MSVENFQSEERKLEKSNWHGKCKGRPWEKFGMSKSLYYYRLANGIPLDKHRGKDKCAERYSGSVYDTPPYDLSKSRRSIGTG